MDEVENEEDLLIAEAMYTGTAVEFTGPFRAGATGFHTSASLLARSKRIASSSFQPFGPPHAAGCKPMSAVRNFVAAAQSNAA